MEFQKMVLICTAVTCTMSRVANMYKLHKLDKEYLSRASINESENVHIFSTEGRESQFRNTVHTETMLYQYWEYMRLLLCYGMLYEQYCHLQASAGVVW